MYKYSRHQPSYRHVYIYSYNEHLLYILSMTSSYIQSVLTRIGFMFRLHLDKLLGGTCFDMGR